MRFEYLRKFTVAMTVIVLASVLCWFGKIEDAAYATIITGVSGLFFTGNVVTHMKGEPK